MENNDVVLVVGANDVVNSAAQVARVHHFRTESDMRKSGP